MLPAVLFCFWDMNYVSAILTDCTIEVSNIVLLHTLSITLERANWTWRWILIYERVPTPTQAFLLQQVQTPSRLQWKVPYKWVWVYGLQAFANKVGVHGEIVILAPIGSFAADCAILILLCQVYAVNATNTKMHTSWSLTLISCSVRVRRWSSGLSRSACFRYTEESTDASFLEILNRSWRNTSNTYHSLVVSTYLIGNHGHGEAYLFDRSIFCFSCCPDANTSRNLAFENVSSKGVSKRRRLLECSRQCSRIRLIPFGG